MKTITDQIAKVSLLLTILFYANSGFAQIQNPCWIVPNTEVKFNNSGITNIINLTTNIVAPANGICDNNGNLLFFVQGSGLYDGSGNLIGNLKIGSPQPESNKKGKKPGAVANRGYEVPIIPVPDECDKYYVIYTRNYTPGGPANNFNDVFYAVVDVSGGIVQILLKDQFITTAPVIILPTFAVSHLKNDLGFNYHRLYIVGNGVEKYIIDQFSIYFSNSILSGSGLIYQGLEADLSHDDTQLAWGVRKSSTINSYIVVQLNSSGDYISHNEYQITTNSAEKEGVEFSPNGNFLYVTTGTSPIIHPSYTPAANDGINVIDLSSGTPIHIPNSENYAESFLELAFDGKIYAADHENFAAIDLPSNTIGSPIFIATYPPSIDLHQLFLPDQIDGFNYNQLHFTLTISSIDATCSGICNGEATVTATSGTSPYTYLWDDPLSQTTATATGLCEGIYTVTVTDANGCIAVISVTINEPAVLTATITASADASCLGICDGEATVTVTGGSPFFCDPICNGGTYTYLWDDPSAQTTATATGLCAGIYTVTVTDANGCIATVSVTINEPAGLTATITSSIDASCPGICNGEATVTATGGTAPYTY
ncbi:MAG: hypothetical protein FVQ77_10990, partial [Cytophagales bacterium]|nr:hypothetical protein [Cytophagales bacterium]